MFGRGWRLLIHILAPLRYVQEAQWWIALISQVAVLVALASAALSFLVGSPLVTVVYLLVVALALTLLAGYRLLSDNDELHDQRAQVEIFFEKRFPMWWEEQGWYRIGVRNRSPVVQARDVDVTLRSF